MPKPPVASVARSAMSSSGNNAADALAPRASGSRRPSSPAPLSEGRPQHGSMPVRYAGGDAAAVADVEALSAGTPAENAPSLPSRLPSGDPPDARANATVEDTGDETGDASGAGADNGTGCYRLRHVMVSELLEDGTLGLLLHGTSVVGFCSQRAEETGWCVGDQIVEVNGQRVTMFDEFLDRFMAAQEKGFPIDFSVLRRESCGQGESVPQDGAEGALERFFGATSLVDLAGQLHRKFGSPGGPAGDGEASMGTGNIKQNMSESPDDLGSGRGGESIIENPYIQALRKRRTELLRSAEGWATDLSDTLASRLATQRCDALATLTKQVPLEDDRRSSRVPPSISGLPPEWFACVPGQCRSHAAACHGDIQPTPRIDPLETEGKIGMIWGQATHRCRHGSIDSSGFSGTEDTGQVLASQLAASGSDAGANSTAGASARSANKSAGATLAATPPSEESKNFAQQLLTR